MVQGLGLKRDRGCQLSELMDSPPGVLSTTGPAERCLAVAPETKSPILQVGKLMLKVVESKVKEAQSWQRELLC